MSGRLVLLGPQHPRPNLPAVLDELGTGGPIGVISAGWRHDEAQLDTLEHAVQRPVLPLPLYRWFEELEPGARELCAAWHGRQARVRAFKRAYGIELRAALQVQARLEEGTGRDRVVFDQELAYAHELLRQLDSRALVRLDELRAAHPRTLQPWRDPAVRQRHEQARELLERTEVLCIAGGHVAILLNRMQFFGIHHLLRDYLEDGRTLVAWSAGAMALTERIVLFYDDPPEGPGDPELLDRGLGLVPGVVLLPHARRRLRLRQTERMGRMASRFLPRRCLTLENGSALELVEGALVDRGPPGTSHELQLDGSLRACSHREGQPLPEPSLASGGFRPSTSDHLAEEPAPAPRGGGSQALADLARAVEARPQRSSELILAFVGSHDFPLVDDKLATFFFYDGQPADQVKLVHWIFGLESRQELARLGRTDAWYLSVELPHAARVEYKLEVHRDGRSEWIRDPLNPCQAFDPFGSNSVLPMPGYREAPWVRREPHVRRGRLDSFVLRSRAWGNERPVGVYLPYEYRPEKRYPLLICHDGSDYRRYADLVPVLDNLVHRHEVQPLVVAFTDGVDRAREYGAHPQQPAWLVDELLPALAQRYAISDEPEERGLMGASFGAVSSLWTAWRRPGTFGRLLLQSGSFVFTDVGHHGRGPLWDPVVAFVNDYRLAPGPARAKIYMSCGRFESLITYNRALVPLMRRAGLELRFRESDDGHNWICWRDRLREGLSWLYPGHLWMTYD